MSRFFCSTGAAATRLAKAMEEAAMKVAVLILNVVLVFSALEASCRNVELS
jgi:hypothetical protein